MRRIFSPIAAVAAALAAAVSLGGCNQTAGAPPPVAAAPAPGTGAPAWPPLPENAACTESLNSYQKVLTADVTTGNLAHSVYDQIEVDLMRAANACAAGKDGEAAGIIRATRIKHGYHA